MKKIEDFYKESPTKTNSRYLIISKSSDLFSESGMDGVSMVEVAEACNITTRNLYRYYPNKEMLAVDVAYHVITTSDAIDEFRLNDEDSGYDSVKKIIDYLYRQDHSVSEELKFAKFIMYFDLYIAKMDKTHPAFELYSTQYVKEMNYTVKTKLSIALKKGIHDGSITISEAEIDFYDEYIIQSLFSIFLRVMIKETENKSINQALLEKHIEVILKHISC